MKEKLITLEHQAVKEGRLQVSCNNHLVPQLTEWTQNEIVKHIYKWLEKNYEPGVEEKLDTSGALTKNKVIGVRNGSGEVIMNISAHDLFLRMEEQFKDRLNKSDHRTKFLKQCIIDWFNGVDGMKNGHLSKNVLMEKKKLYISDKQVKLLQEHILQINETPVLDENKLLDSYVVTWDNLTEHYNRNKHLYEGLIKSEPIDKLQHKIIEYDLEYNHVCKILTREGSFTKFIQMLVDERNLKKLEQLLKQMGYYISQKESYKDNIFSVVIVAKFDNELNSSLRDKKLYHLTNIKNWKRISQQGLTPRSGCKVDTHEDRIYFTYNEQAYSNLIESSEFTLDTRYFAVLEFDYRKGCPYRLFADPKMAGAVYTLETIDPKFIKLTNILDVDEGKYVGKDNYEKCVQDEIIKIRNKQKNENVIYEIEPQEISLNSFEVHHDLNPRLFDNSNIRKNVRLRLIDIAYDFIDFIDLPFVKPTDIVIVGSNVGFQWSKYSDIDLHIVYDFKQISNKTNLVRDMLDGKKNMWNNERQITIYGYVVELYVEDEAEPAHSNGRYSILHNAWVKYPTPLPSIKEDKWLIKQASAKIINKIESYMEQYDKMYNMEMLAIKVNKLWAFIKGMRKSGIARDGESSYENYIFKIIRKLGYLEKLYKLKNDVYVFQKSIR